MICDECGENNATIRIQTTVNGTTQEKNVCAKCMAKIKASMKPLDLEGLAGLLSGFFQQAQAKKGESSEPVIDITCEKCGQTYEDFKKSGLLGCADCYRAFREPLSKLISNVHAGTQHAGRAPGGMATQVTLEQLREKLMKAVATEEYEEAAKLRDKIREIKASLEAEKNG